MSYDMVYFSNRQLSITLRMLPIRSHALRKLHLLDFSLHFARDKSGVAFPRNLVG